MIQRIRDRLRDMIDYVAIGTVWAILWIWEHIPEPDGDGMDLDEPKKEIK